MGTWDDGLYDRDDALDALGGIFEIVEDNLDASPAHFFAGLGLLAWMEASSLAVHPEKFQQCIDRHRDWVDAAPPRARERILALYADPKQFAERDGSRPPEITAVLGGYCDGPREDALLTVPGADAVIAELAERCCAVLDAMTEDTKEWSGDLYERSSELAPLGVILELTTLGVRIPRERVAAWREAFEFVNENTPDEREFYDRYAARVRKGFDFLEGLT